MAQRYWSKYISPHHPSELIYINCNLVWRLEWLKRYRWRCWGIFVANIFQKISNFMWNKRSNLLDCKYQYSKVKIFQLSKILTVTFIIKIILTSLIDQESESMAKSRLFRTNLSRIAGTYATMDEVSFGAQNLFNLKTF
jgi:hypothetical protein